MRRCLLVALVCFLAAAGCGRDGDDLAEDTQTIAEPVVAVSPTPSPLPVELVGPVNNLGTKDLRDMGAAVTLDMALSNFAFDPTFVQVTPGANVKFVLSSDAELADHTFTIDSLSVDGQLAPGEEAEIVVQLPQEGPFRFYCRFHADQGMQGAIFFGEGEQLSVGESSGLPESSASGTSSRSRAPGTSRTTGATGTTRSTTPSSSSSPSSPSGSSTSHECTGNDPFCVPDFNPDVPVGGSIGGDPAQSTDARAHDSGSQSAQTSGATSGTRSFDSRSAPGTSGGNAGSNSPDGKDAPKSAPDGADGAPGN